MRRDGQGGADGRARPMAAGPDARTCTHTTTTTSCAASRMPGLHRDQRVARPYGLFCTGTGAGTVRTVHSHSQSVTDRSSCVHNLTGTQSYRYPGRALERKNETPGSHGRPCETSTTTPTQTTRPFTPCEPNDAPITETVSSTSRWPSRPRSRGYAPHAGRSGGVDPEGCAQADRPAGGRQEEAP